MQQNQHRNNNYPQPTETNGNADINRPDYIAMQYRVVRNDKGWKTRKERIGAAFLNANGAICFRPAGQQIIDNDVYLFPNAE